mmetsp:Transcript_20443/g.62307  ORF Transcript_20443/g.62307 Transcript_20443/m.62307 type:complete len:298 (+) Transcript_20443:130-1023(+)
MRLRLVKNLLDLLHLIELKVVTLERHGKHVLEAAHNDRRQRRLSENTKGKRDGGDKADTLCKLGHQLGVGDIQHLRREDATLENVDEAEAVLEGPDTELLQERRLGGANLGALNNHLAVVDDLNGTLVDLRRDVQRLEEGSLRRVEAGRTFGDGARARRDDTGLGGRRLHKLKELVFDLANVAVGENETQVAAHDGNDGLQVGAILALSLRLRNHVANASTNHGVFAVDHLCLTTEGDADVRDLLRADEIEVDDGRTSIGVEGLLEVGEIGDLLRLGDHCSLGGLERRRLGATVSGS